MFIGFWCNFYLRVIGLVEVTNGIFITQFSFSLSNLEKNLKYWQLINKIFATDLASVGTFIGICGSLSLGGCVWITWDTLSLLIIRLVRSSGTQGANIGGGIEVLACQTDGQGTVWDLTGTRFRCCEAFGTCLTSQMDPLLPVLSQLAGYTLAV